MNDNTKASDLQGLHFIANSTTKYYFGNTESKDKIEICWDAQPENGVTRSGRSIYNMATIISQFKTDTWRFVKTSCETCKG
jgi:hypothetical protein